MKHAVKGVLFSGLVFPGLGQIVLQRKQRGFIIVTIVVVSLSIFIMKIMGIAMAIVEETQSQNGIVDVANIANTATRLTTDSAEYTLNFLLVLVLVCLIGSAIDAYNIGKQLDAAELS